MEDGATLAKGCIGALLGVVLFVGIGIAGWQFDWWLKAKNTDKQVEIDNRNLGTQTAWQDEAKKLIREADLLPEGAPQAAALRQDACELIDKLTDSYMTDQLADFESAYC